MATTTTPDTTATNPTPNAFDGVTKVDPSKTLVSTQAVPFADLLKGTIQKNYTILGDASKFKPIDTGITDDYQNYVKKLTENVSYKADISNIRDATAIANNFGLPADIKSQTITENGKSFLQFEAPRVTLPALTQQFKDLTVKDSDLSGEVKALDLLTKSKDYFNTDQKFNDSFWGKYLQESQDKPNYLVSTEGDKKGQLLSVLPISTNKIGSEEYRNKFIQSNSADIVKNSLGDLYAIPEVNDTNFDTFAKQAIRQEKLSGIGYAGIVPSGGFNPYDFALRDSIISSQVSTTGKALNKKDLQSLNSQIRNETDKTQFKNNFGSPDLASNALKISINRSDPQKEVEEIIDNAGFQATKGNYFNAGTSLIGENVAGTPVISTGLRGLNAFYNSSKDTVQNIAIGNIGATGLTFTKQEDINTRANQIISSGNKTTFFEKVDALQQARQELTSKRYEAGAGQIGLDASYGRFGYDFMGASFDIGASIGVGVLTGGAGVAAKAGQVATLGSRLGQTAVGALKFTGSYPAISTLGANYSGMNSQEITQAGAKNYAIAQASVLLNDKITGVVINNLPKLGGFLGAGLSRTPMLQEILQNPANLSRLLGAYNAYSKTPALSTFGGKIGSILNGTAISAVDASADVMISWGVGSVFESLKAGKLKSDNAQVSLDNLGGEFAFSMAYGFLPELMMGGKGRQANINEIDNIKQKTSLTGLTFDSLSKTVAENLRAKNAGISINEADIIKEVFGDVKDIEKGITSFEVSKVNTTDVLSNDKESRSQKYIVRTLVNKTSDASNVADLYLVKIKTNTDKGSVETNTYFTAGILNGKANVMSEASLLKEPLYQTYQDTGKKLDYLELTVTAPNFDKFINSEAFGKIVKDGKEVSVSLQGKVYKDANGNEYDGKDVREPISKSQYINENLGENIDAFIGANAISKELFEKYNLKKLNDPVGLINDIKEQFRLNREAIKQIEKESSQVKEQDSKKLEQVKEKLGGQDNLDRYVVGKIIDKANQGIQPTMDETFQALEYPKESWADLEKYYQDNKALIELGQKALETKTEVAAKKVKKTTLSGNEITPKQEVIVKEKLLNDFEDIYSNKKDFTEANLQYYADKFGVKKDDIYIGDYDYEVSQNINLEGKKVILGNVRLEEYYLLPSTIEHIAGNLEIEDGVLVNIKSVGGNADVVYTNQSILGNKLEYIGGDLFISDLITKSSIKNLGALKYVGGNVEVNRNLESLGSLKYVGGTLRLGNSKVASLDNVKYVGRQLSLINSKSISSLGDLKYAGEIRFIPIQFQEDYIKENPEKVKLNKERERKIEREIKKIETSETGAATQKVKKINKPTIEKVVDKTPVKEITKKTNATNIVKTAIQEVSQQSKELAEVSIDYEAAENLSARYGVDIPLDSLETVKNFDSNNRDIEDELARLKRMTKDKTFAFARKVSNLAKEDRVSRVDEISGELADKFPGYFNTEMKPDDITRKVEDIYVFIKDLKKQQRELLKTVLEYKYNTDSEFKALWDNLDKNDVSQAFLDKYGESILNPSKYYDFRYRENSTQSQEVAGAFTTVNGVKTILVSANLLNPSVENKTKELITLAHEAAHAFVSTLNPKEKLAFLSSIKSFNDKLNSGETITEKDLYDAEETAVEALAREYVAQGIYSKEQAAKQAKTLWQKFKDYLSNILQGVKGLFSKDKADNTSYSQELQSFADSFIKDNQVDTEKLSKNQQDFETWLSTPTKDIPKEVLIRFRESLNLDEYVKLFSSLTDSEIENISPEDKPVSFNNGKEIEFNYRIQEPGKGDTLLYIDEDGVSYGHLSFENLGDGSYQVRSLYVDPTERGKGVATRIYENLLRYADSQGVRVLSDTAREPEDTAIWKKLSKNNDIIFDEQENVFIYTPKTKAKFRTSETFKLSELGSRLPKGYEKGLELIMKKAGIKAARRFSLERGGISDLNGIEVNDLYNRFKEGEKSADGKGYITPGLFALPEIVKTNEALIEAGVLVPRPFTRPQNIISVPGNKDLVGIDASKAHHIVVTRQFATDRGFLPNNYTPWDMWRYLGFNNKSNYQDWLASPKKTGDVTRANQDLIKRNQALIDNKSEVKFRDMEDSTQSPYAFENQDNLKNLQEIKDELTSKLVNNQNVDVREVSTLTKDMVISGKFRELTTEQKKDIALGDENYLKALSPKPKDTFDYGSYINRFLNYLGVADRQLENAREKLINIEKTGTEDQIEKQQKDIKTIEKLINTSNGILDEHPLFKDISINDRKDLGTIIYNEFIKKSAIGKIDRNAWQKALTSLDKRKSDFVANKKANSIPVPETKAIEVQGEVVIAPASMTPEQEETVKGLLKEKAKVNKNIILKAITAPFDLGMGFIDLISISKEDIANRTKTSGDSNLRVDIVEAKIEANAALITVKAQIEDISKRFGLKSQLITNRKFRKDVNELLQSVGDYYIDPKTGNKLVPEIGFTYTSEGKLVPIYNVAVRDSNWGFDNFREHIKMGATITQVYVNPRVGVVKLTYKGDSTTPKSITVEKSIIPIDDAKEYVAKQIKKGESFGTLQYYDEIIDRNPELMKKVSDKYNNKQYSQDVMDTAISLRDYYIRAGVAAKGIGANTVTGNAYVATDVTAVVRNPFTNSGDIGLTKGRATQTLDEIVADGNLNEDAVGVAMGHFKAMELRITDQVLFNNLRSGGLIVDNDRLELISRELANVKDRLELDPTNQDLIIRRDYLTEVYPSLTKNKYSGYYNSKFAIDDTVYHLNGNLHQALYLSKIVPEPPDKQAYEDNHVQNIITNMVLLNRKMVDGIEANPFGYLVSRIIDQNMQANVNQADLLIENTSQVGTEVALTLSTQIAADLLTGNGQLVSALGSNLAASVSNGFKQAIKDTTGFDFINPAKQDEVFKVILNSINASSLARDLFLVEERVIPADGPKILRLANKAMTNKLRQKAFNTALFVQGNLIANLVHAGAVPLITRNLVDNLKKEGLDINNFDVNKKQYRRALAKAVDYAEQAQAISEFESSKSIMYSSIRNNPVLKLAPEVPKYTGWLFSAINVNVKEFKNIKIGLQKDNYGQKDYNRAVKGLFKIGSLAVLAWLAIFLTEDTREELGNKSSTNIKNEQNTSTALPYKIYTDENGNVSIIDLERFLPSQPFTTAYNVSNGLAALMGFDNEAGKRVNDSAVSMVLPGLKESNFKPKGENIAGAFVGSTLIPNQNILNSLSRSFNPTETKNAQGGVSGFAQQAIGKDLARLIGDRTGIEALKSPDKSIDVPNKKTGKSDTLVKKNSWATGLIDTFIPGGLQRINLDALQAGIGRSQDNLDKKIATLNKDLASGKITKQGYDEELQKQKDVANKNNLDFNTNATGSSSSSGGKVSKSGSGGSAGGSKLKASVSKVKKVKKAKTPKLKKLSSSKLKLRTSSPKIKLPKLKVKSISGGSVNSARGSIRKVSAPKVSNRSSGSIKVKSVRIKAPKLITTYRNLPQAREL